MKDVKKMSPSEIEDELSELTDNLPKGYRNLLNAVNHFLHVKKSKEKAIERLRGLIEIGYRYANRINDLQNEMQRRYDIETKAKVTRPELGIPVE